MLIVGQKHKYHKENTEFLSDWGCWSRSKCKKNCVSV